MTVEEILGLGRSSAARRFTLRTGCSLVEAEIAAAVERKMNMQLSLKDLEDAYTAALIADREPDQLPESGR